MSMNSKIGTLRQRSHKFDLPSYCRPMAAMRWRSPRSAFFWRATSPSSREIRRCRCGCPAGSYDGHGFDDIRASVPSVIGSVSSSKSMVGTTGPPQRSSRISSAVRRWYKPGGDICWRHSSETSSGVVRSFCVEKKQKYIRIEVHISLSNMK